MPTGGGMGFFDDLDEEVGVPADRIHGRPNADALRVVADKLTTGWQFSDKITTPGKNDGEFLDQVFRLSFDGRRYVYTTCLVRRRGKMQETHDENTRQLDRAGLLDMLNDQPLVARKAVAGAGVEVPDEVPGKF